MGFVGTAVLFGNLIQSSVHNLNNYAIGTTGKLEGSSLFLRMIMWIVRLVKNKQRRPAQINQSPVSSSPDSIKPFT